MLLTIQLVISYEFDTRSIARGQTLCVVLRFGRFSNLRTNIRNDTSQNDDK